MFADYAEKHIIGKRILARNNCILYAVSEKNIISIKDGKVGKYTGTNGFRKINRVNAIIAKFLTILKLQPNRATLRSDPTQAVR